MAIATVTCLAILLMVIHRTYSQAFNPAILQDSRDLPKVDGAFGFLYRTEDGIAHAAKGEPGGVVHGRFTYTDPTGLKVNYNYNAGSRVTPKYNYNEPLSSYEQQQSAYNEERPPNTYTSRQEQYDEPAPAPPTYDSNQQQYEYSQQRRTRPPSLNSRNAINNNYEY